MDFNIDNLMQLIVIVVCAYFSLKIAGKFIKFILFIAVVIIGIKFLLDTGVINM